MTNSRGPGRTKAPTPRGSCPASLAPSRQEGEDRTHRDRPGLWNQTKALNPAPPSVNCPRPSSFLRAGQRAAQGGLSAYHTDSETGHSCLEFLGREADNQGKCVDTRVSRLSLPQPPPVLSAFLLWTSAGKDEGDRRQVIGPSGIKGFAQVYNITPSTRPL